MPLPEPVKALIAAARRRLTIAWTLRAVAVAAGAAAAAASILIAVSRHWVILWAEPVGWGLIAVAVVSTAVAMIVSRPSAARSAIEIDRRLEGYDRISTALELTESRSELTEPEARQVASADAWARSRSVDGLVGLVPSKPLPQLAALALAAVVALSVIPAPTDAAIAQMREDRAVLEAEADRLDDLAEEAPPEVAEMLEEIAEELRNADSVESALENLGEARRELLDSLDPADLAKRTALAGMEQALERNPLAEGADAAEQLEQLAEDLANLDPDEAVRAARELDQRAADFAGVDQEMSDALSEAADRLSLIATGDRSSQTEAAEALRRAAEGARRAAEDGERSEASRAAASELRAIQERLDAQRGAGQGEGQGDGQGDGQGSADGDGQGQGDGQGSGQGEGQGEGEGQGQGGGQGGGQGAGGQSGAGSGAGSGSGSVPPGSGDDDPASAPSRDEIFDPLDFSSGDEVRVPVDGADPGDLLGTADGLGIDNDAVTPYTERFAEYRQRALESLDALVVPSSVEEIVRDYFTRLEP